MRWLPAFIFVVRIQIILSHEAVDRNHLPFPLLFVNASNITTPRNLAEGDTPEEAVAALSQHSFIFVGGLPQSGTSVLRKLMISGSYASGMDECIKTTRCSMFNIEGQWLLSQATKDDKKLRDAYAPGSEEKWKDKDDYIELRDDMRTYLWRCWSRYWDESKDFLVEKSPSNVIKIPWLANIFSLSRHVRFVMVVKNPVANSHFERPRKCLCLGCNSRKHEGNCRNETELFWARLAYIRHWTEVHEHVVLQLSAWPESEEIVRFARYDLLEEPCTCEKLLHFAFSDKEGQWLVENHMSSRICATSSTCPEGAFLRGGGEAPGTRKDRHRHRHLLGNKTMKKNEEGNHDNDDRRDDADLNHRNRRDRRLGYFASGGDTGVVRFMPDAHTKSRNRQWAEFLRKKEGSSLISDEAAKKVFATFEPRIRQLGYSFLTPSLRVYDPHNASTDAFACWSIHHDVRAKPATCAHLPTTNTR